MMRRRLLPAAPGTMAALTFLVASAAAEEHTVVQLGKRFTVPEITVYRGDWVNFRNEDQYTHNLYSDSPAKRFDVGAQEPGKTVRVHFDTPGKVMVRCAIHPKMKLEVIVRPAR